MIQLFVEGYEVDVKESLSIMLTYAIDDIKDFGAKNCTFSKTIVIPGTKKNNALFGNIFEVTAYQNYDPTVKNIGLNFNAAVSASAYIFNDNIQCFKGVLRIVEIISDNGTIEYEAVVFGELGNFVAKVGSNKLTGNLNVDGTENTAADLDFSAYNHTYSLANIVASWSNASGGSGYYYPLIDYGNYSILKHNWDVLTLRPAFFVKEFIDKIFSNAGYTYDCALFNTVRFKSLIVPNTFKKLFRKATTALDILDDHTTINSAGAAIVYVPFTVQTILGDFVPDGANQQFTYSVATSVTGIYTLHIKGSYTKTSTTALVFTIYKNSTSIASYSMGAGLTGLHTFDFTISSASLATNNGDIISVQLSGNTLSGNTFSANMTTYELTLTTASISNVSINYGENLLANSILPQNILQKDFISSIIKLFNLYVFEDTQIENHLLIMPFVDFYANASAEDWSNKVDRSKPIKLKPMSELNARYYQFNFKKDTDYYNDIYEKRYNETYGSLIYDSAFEFAKETNKVELIFSGTPLVGYTGEDKVYSTIFKRSGNVGAYVEENIDSNIRILQAKKVTGVSSWNILNGSTVLGSYTNYPYAGHLDNPDNPTNDIQFGVPKELFFTLVIGALNINQFNVYWSSYMAEITDKDSRLMMAVVRLAYKDIYGLDFSKLKWIDGSLFRLNKIVDFNATNEDTCKVELLKVINKIY